jgi:hypothetical protein
MTRHPLPPLTSCSLIFVTLDLNLYSPRLAACAADLPFIFPTFAVSFGVACHIIASAIACWPLYNWAPGLFHHLENVEATNTSLPLGPKDSLSLICPLDMQLMSNFSPETTNA